jgi:tartrate dehydratase alpha subunit/fumarate hydratase class I-like protein
VNNPVSNTTVNYNETNYTAPVNFTITPGQIMNITTLNPGFTTENKIVTISDVSGNGYQQITFILSETLVRRNLLTN